MGVFLCFNAHGEAIKVAQPRMFYGELWRVYGADEYDFRRKSSGLCERVKECDAIPFFHTFCRSRARAEVIRSQLHLIDHVTVEGLELRFFVFQSTKKFLCACIDFLCWGKGRHNRVSPGIKLFFLVVKSVPLRPRKIFCTRRAP